MITVPQIAWAAGFLEGEGSFGCYGGTPRVTAAQVQKEPLDRLAMMFGGRMWLKPAGNGFRNKKPIWTWVLNKQRSAEVMMTLYTFMSPKRQDEIEKSLGAWKASRSIRKAGAKMCLRGHAIEGYNAMVVPDRTYPICRTCKNDVRKAWRHRTGKK